MLGLQILIDGFAISSLYALGATGFTLMFGVSGVLNLSHGSIMVAAAVAAWAALRAIWAATPIWAPWAGSASACVGRLCHLFRSSSGPSSAPRRSPMRRPRSSCSPARFSGGIMIQEAIAYFFTSNPKTVRPIGAGRDQYPGRAHAHERDRDGVICWAVIGLLWLLVNRTRAGKVVLAASINPRGVTLLGFELSNIYILVWTIYGILAGIAGVLLAMFLGVSSDGAGPLTASAFSIVVLGGLGSVSGSLIAAYVVGYMETLTAYLISPAYRTIPVAAAAGAGGLCPPAGPARPALGESIIMFADVSSASRAVTGSPSSSWCSPRHPAALCHRLYPGRADARLLLRRLRHVLGPAVRLCRRGQFRPHLPDRARRLHGAASSTANWGWPIPACVLAGR